MVPILVFTYNRPLHTFQTLTALSNNFGAENTDVIIYSDGPKRDSDIPLIKKVRQICSEINGFRSTKLIEREKNYGLAENIISGVSTEIKKYGSIIVLEDDLLTTSGFIQYMNDALLFYRNTDVFAISAYSPYISLPDNYTYSTYFSARIGSWGWATWEEKWNLANWGLDDFDEFIQSPGKREIFNQGGNDLSIMLMRQKKKQINSWAIRFCFSCYKNGNKVVFPVVSLVQNIGIDGSGTHMKRTRKYDSPTVKSIDSSLFCPVTVQNTEITRLFRKINTPSLIRRIINFVKLRLYLLQIFFRHKMLTHFNSSRE